MLFKFTDIEQNAGSIINKWMIAYDSIDSVLNLYFLSKFGRHKFWENKFLYLVQGVESYHRRTSNETWLDQADYDSIVETMISNCPDKYKEDFSKKLKYGNELSLAKRLKNLMSPFKKLFYPGKKRKYTIRKIVDNRNYLTHYDKESIQKLENGIKLPELCTTLEILLQLHLLKEIGLTDDKAIAKANIYKLRLIGFQIQDL
jgi:hypothetical protein